MANDLNSVVLVGNLTRDAEVTFMQSGMAVAAMSIASNRSRKSGEEWINEVSYYDISLYGKTAENLQQYLKKGQKIAVQGHLKQDRWEKEGQKYSKIRIICDAIQLVGGRLEGNTSGNTAANNGNTKPYNAVPAEAAMIQAEFGGEFQEDIPF